MHDESAFPAKADSFFSYGIRIDVRKHACPVLVESTQTHYTMVTQDTSEIVQIKNLI